MLKAELASLSAPRPSDVLERGEQLAALVESAVEQAVRAGDLHLALEIIRSLATLRASAALQDRPRLLASVRLGAEGAARSVLAAHAQVSDELAGAMAHAATQNTPRSRNFGAQSAGFQRALADDAAKLELALADEAASLRDVVALIKQAMIGIMAVQLAL